MLRLICIIMTSRINILRFKANKLILMQMKHLSVFLMFFFSLYVFFFPQLTDPDNMILIEVILKDIFFFIFTCILSILIGLHQ